MYLLRIFVGTDRGFHNVSNCVCFYLLIEFSWLRKLYVYTIFLLNSNN